MKGEEIGASEVVEGGRSVVYKLESFSCDKKQKKKKKKKRKIENQMAVADQREWCLEIKLVFFVCFGNQVGIR